MKWPFAQNRRDPLPRLRYDGELHRADLPALAPRRRPPSRLRTGTLRLAGGMANLAGETVALVWRCYPILLLLALLGGAGYGGWFFLFESNFFRLMEVRVLDAEPEIEGEVRALAGLETKADVNLIEISADTVAARVESHPKIRWAEVRKLYPGVLEIQVQQREPLALLTTSPMFLIDEEGVALDELKPGDFAQLPPMPFISGVAGAAVTLGDPVDDPALSTLLHLWRTLERANPTLAGQVAELHHEAGENGFQIIFRSGARVLLGRRPGPRQLAQIESMVDTFDSLEGFRIVDMRFHGQIVYTLEEIPS